MKGYIDRKLEDQVTTYLSEFPAVAILGPRQTGKTTLAKKIVSNNPDAIYLDLEKQSDLRKLHEPELFFQANRDSLICLDEIQRIPELFSTLRSVIDDRDRGAQFLILGSASRDLIKQSSESLAGRMAFLELSPLSLVEIGNSDVSAHIKLEDLWTRGGFPRSVLSKADKTSVAWRQNFIRTFLERDIPQLGFQVPAASIGRLWQMLAHQQGQLLNASRLGAALGVSHTTVRSYLDLLSQTFMIRLLPPLLPNLKKRLVKSPKVYIRDAGILHSLLEIDNYNNLLGHPAYGNSWEGFALENILLAYPDWQASFFRTSAGSELDLVLSRGQRRIAVEFKASSAPHLTKGFWNSLNDLAVDKAWVISLVEAAYPIRKNVTVAPLEHFLGLELHNGG